MRGAAIEQFNANGYAGATTAAIARQAGVSEALLFKHFGSKAELFQNAIFKPLDQHFTAFQEKHAEEFDRLDFREAGSREYIEELQKFIAEHSRMFMALIVTQTYRSSGVGSVAEIQGLHDYFDRMATMAERSMGRTSKIAPALIARVSFATLLACILFKDWLFADDADGGGEVLTTAITDFVMEGVNANRGPA